MVKLALAGFKASHYFRTDEAGGSTSASCRRPAAFSAH
jgi:hypothetical protein